MANYEATRYDFDGANLTGIEGIPTATIVPWSTASVPTGFLECDGQAVSQATYSALFAIIGTTYGDPGGGNFNVPDLQDNVPLGKSNTKSIASTGGANAVTPTGNIAGSTANATLTTAQLASHTHNAANATGTKMFNDPAAPNPFATPSSTGSTGSDSGHAHNMSANFTGDSVSTLQPYLTVMYIIKT
jgi:microcystin-dependent protein